MPINHDVVGFIATPLLKVCVGVFLCEEYTISTGTDTHRCKHNKRSGQVV